MELDILALASDFTHFSGPNNPILDLGNFLATRSDRRFAVMTHAGDVEPSFGDSLGFPVLREMAGSSSVGAIRLSAAPVNLAILRRALQRVRPSSVIVFSSVDTAFELAWATRRRIIAGHNVLLNVAGRRFYRESGQLWPSYRLREELLFGALDRVAALSIVGRILAHTDFHKQLYMELGIPEERITVIPHCIDMARLDASVADERPPPSSSHAFTLLYVGRLEPEKGVSQLLEAAALASQESLLRLNVVGDGSLRGFVAEASRSLGRDGRLAIEYHSRLSLSALAAAIRDCDAVIIPSFAEPFGIVALEAMTLGKPVIGVSRGGLAEVVRDGEQGLMVPRPDPPLLARAIIQLQEEPGLRSRLGSGGRRRVAETYDVRVVVPRFVRFMEDAADGPES